MEVGEQPVHHPEAVARGDEQIRLAAARHAAAGFQRPQRRGADGHHRPSLGLGAGDSLCRLGRQRVALAVHVVLRQVFGAYRQEGARTHVQRQVCAFDAARLQRCQQRLVEVQASRGGGHRARLAGEHRLIARLVGLIRLVLDVGRQRQLAQPLQHPGCWCIEADAQHHAARLARRDDRGALRGLFRPEVQPAARLGRVAGAHHRQHLVLAVDALDHHLDASAAFLASRQPCVDDLRVVEHQQAAGRDEFRQIGQPPVGSGGLGQPHQRCHVQQPPAGALLGRVLGNQFLGQVIVEIGQLHRDGSGKGAGITERVKASRDGLMRKGWALRGSGAASVGRQRHSRPAWSAGVAWASRPESHGAARSGLPRPATPAAGCPDPAGV